MIRIDTWSPKVQARFMRDGYRFIVRKDQVLVYEYDRWGNTEYSLNKSANEDRSAYDARRYQIRKNKTVIDAVQTLINS